MESTPWEVVDRHNNHLRIRYISDGDCREWRGVRIVETPQSVEVWTVVKPPKSDPDCTLTYDVNATNIQLKKPLAKRQLLHAPVSSEWAQLVGRF